MIAAAPGEIGPYRLESLLGRGGMGEVYQAYDQRLDRRVAIKHILPANAAKPTQRARLRREVWAVAQLSHPAIVQIFDILQQEDGDWFVMELIDGATVAAMLHDGPLPLDAVLTYGRQIAEGLAAAHAKDIIHRDLKAENVMVTPAAHVKILDFGLAKPLAPGHKEGTISRQGQILGTSRAMSPEQARGLTVAPRSDLFSFGTLLYEMATGHSPFQAATRVDTLTRVCTHRQPPLDRLRPEVSPTLATLVDQLLEKTPTLRPASAAVVAAALREMEAAYRVSQPAQPTPTAGLALDQQTELSGTKIAATPNPSSSPPKTPPLTPASGARSGSFAALRWRPALGWAGLILLVALAIGGLRGWQTTRSAPAELAAGMALLRRYDTTGSLDQAIDTFHRIMARDQGSAAAHAGLARAYWLKYYSESKDPLWLEQALPVAQRAVQLDEQLAAARVSLGWIYGALGRREEAAEELTLALQLAPDNAEAHSGLAQIYTQQNRFEAAEAAYKKAIALRPDDRLLYDRLGDLYFESGRYAEAETCFQRSIELAPEGIFGYRNLAAVYQMQGRYSEAAAWLEKALAIQPLSSLYSNLGALLFVQGLYPQSVVAFEKAMETSGGSNKYLMWANLADAYRWTPDNEAKAGDAYLRAIQLIGEELATKPDSTVLRSRLALYRAKRGDHAKARVVLARLAQQADLRAATRYRIAVTYELVGARQEALSTLEEALHKGYPSHEAQRDPELLALRADPRYHRMMMKIDRGQNLEGH